MEALVAGSFCGCEPTPANRARMSSLDQVLLFGLEGGLLLGSDLNGRLQVSLIDGNGISEFLDLNLDMRLHLLNGDLEVCDLTLASLDLEHASAPLGEILLHFNVLFAEMSDLVEIHVQIVSVVPGQIIFRILASIGEMMEGQLRNISVLHCVHQGVLGLGSLILELLSNILVAEKSDLVEIHVRILNHVNEFVGICAYCYCIFKF